MKLLLSIIIAFISLTLSAQEMATNYFTTSEAAVAYAEENEGNILMVFGGSDWCRPCIKFKKEILVDTLFVNSTLEKTAVLYLDFPSKKKNQLSSKLQKHNEDLAAQFNTSGSFPKIILTDHQMKKIKEIPYEGQSTEAFLTELHQ